MIQVGYLRLQEIFRIPSRPTKHALPLPHVRASLTPNQHWPSPPRFQNKPHRSESTGCLQACNPRTCVFNPSLLQASLNIDIPEIQTRDTNIAAAIIGSSATDGKLLMMIRLTDASLTVTATDGLLCQQSPCATRTAKSSSLWKYSKGLSPTSGHRR